MIHYGVYDLGGEFLNWFAAVYSLNQLEHQRKLWNDIEKLNKQQKGPWYIITDFNSVVSTKDKICGKLVREMEYIDLTNMMEKTRLF